MNAFAFACRNSASVITPRSPFLDGVQPVTTDPAQQLINHTWKPMLEITGADGLPPCDRAGNVLRAETSLYLSLRVPPTRTRSRPATC